MSIAHIPRTEMMRMLLRFGFCLQFLLESPERCGGRRICHAFRLFKTAPALLFQPAPVRNLTSIKKTTQNKPQMIQMLYYICYIIYVILHIYIILYILYYIYIYYYIHNITYIILYILYYI